MINRPPRPTIVPVDDPEPHEIAELIRSLVAFNDTAAPAEEYRKLAVFAREGDALVGGASGHTHWQWLFVSHLWVAETHRNTGLGNDLLQTIERQAIGRGCRFAWLDTFSFQAPDFYRKQGYEEFGKLDDYPSGYSRHFFWKPLTA